MIIVKKTARTTFRERKDEIMISRNNIAIGGDLNWYLHQDISTATKKFINESEFPKLTKSFSHFRIQIV